MPRLPRLEPEFFCSAHSAIFISITTQNRGTQKASLIREKLSLPIDWEADPVSRAGRASERTIKSYILEISPKTAGENSWSFCYVPFLREERMSIEGSGFPLLHGIRNTPSCVGWKNSTFRSLDGSPGTGEADRSEAFPRLYERNFSTRSLRHPRTCAEIWRISKDAADVLKLPPPQRW